MKRPDQKTPLLDGYAGKKILDVGCGAKKTKGAIGLDFVNFDGVDVIHDLNQVPFPFENDFFDLITMSHVIEHVANIPTVMQELARILKQNGRLWIATPHYTDVNSYTDPTHLFHLTSQSFNRFTQPPNKNIFTQELCYVCLKSSGRKLGLEWWINNSSTEPSVNRRLTRWEKFRSHFFRGDEMRFIFRKN
jgi:2-polyprenyl-3-methyl-5-hydroxy-6-metoxy-1,4-benzoquinol methylase